MISRALLLAALAFAPGPATTFYEPELEGVDPLREPSGGGRLWLPPWWGRGRGGLRTFDERHVELAIARRRRANKAARLARRVQRGRR